MTEILIKGVDVKICPRLEEYIATSIKAADPPHFQTNLRGERESVKAKADRMFLEANQSPHPSSPYKTKTKRARKVESMSKQPSSSSTVHKSRSSSKAISISSSSPSPVPAIPHSPGDIINITDSDSSDYHYKPVKRQKAFEIQTVVKQERHSSLLASSTIPPEEKQWPSDYPILDVLHVLHNCKPPPQGITVAQHFYSLTGLRFKSSTYYDARSKWDKSTQEQRDKAEGCGDDDLWKDFAVQVPLQKTKLKLARQRVHRHQPIAEDEVSDGSSNSDGSLDNLQTSSSS